MKILKLQKTMPQNAKKPIIKVWYKNIWGKEKVRDAVYNFGDEFNYWKWFDNGDDVDVSINKSFQAFWLSDKDSYQANDFQ